MEEGGTKTLYMRQYPQGNWPDLFWINFTRVFDPDFSRRDLFTLQRTLILLQASL